MQAASEIGVAVVGSDPSGARARVGLSTTENDQSVSFANLLKNGIDDVNAQQQQAAVLASGFEAGQGSVDLADVMIASQKAGLAFRAIAQIRNQVVSAYQEVMRMTI